MPSLERDVAPSGPRVDGFAGAGFRVDGKVYETGVKLTEASAWTWVAPSIDQLSTDDLADLLGQPLPEFILLGTGTTLRRPPAIVTAAIEAKGVGLEIMDSRAAARAWGVLRTEGRTIAAALLPLG